MMLFVVTGLLKTDIFLASGNILVQRKSWDFYHFKGANKINKLNLIGTAYLSIPAHSGGGVKLRQAKVYLQRSYCSALLVARV